MREIISLATTGGAGDGLVPAPTDGLTLEQLQQVARESGIDPARVAQAAASVDARARAPLVRRMLGFPIAMTRVVDLPRAPTDREWEQLVAVFRTAFDTPGQMTSTGGLREWSSGSLHIGVEPMAHGEQLRITTRNDGAVALNLLSAFTGGLGALMSAVVAAAGKPEKALAVLTLFGGISLASFAINLWQLPRWGRTRARQVEELADQAVTLLSDPK